MSYASRAIVVATFASLSLPVALRAQATSGPAHTDRTLDIADRRQVFIDGRFLKEAKGVALVVHPPVKTGERTLEPDRPWESKYGTYNSVLEHHGTYHMWYRAGNAMCYARSKDGIGWDKPALGLVERDGRRDNNIVIGYAAGGAADAGQGAMVFIDPTAPPEQKFRMALRVAAPGKDVNLYSSPDGIHWSLTHPGVLTYNSPDKRHHLDSQNVIFWDDRIGKYVAYLRRNDRKAGSQGRTIARTESPRLGGFAEAQDAPIIIAHDEQDAKAGAYELIDYYTSAAIKYPWAQDAYYMFPTAYFHYVPGEFREFRDGAPINAGPIHTQFAASRDGVAWERFDRRPFVRLGFKGAFDSAAARMIYGLVPSLDGREMYMYYYGSDRPHGWGRDDRNNELLTKAGVQPTQDVTIISRLVLRRDGFVSARAEYTGGEFTTPVVTFSGRELVLNLDTSATGMLQCELQDEAGHPIDGFTLADCDRIHTSNEINRVVTWGGKCDVSLLGGRAVRLRFVFRDTDVYAFQFRSPNSRPDMDHRLGPR